MPTRNANDPRQALANLTRSQYADFKKTFVPIEDQLIDAANQNPEVAATRAGDYAARGFDVSRGIAARAASKAGLQVAPDVAASLKRQNALARTEAIASAENTTRRGLYDRNLNLEGYLAGLGQAAAGRAQQGLSQGASLATQRHNANERIKQQNDQQTASTLGTIASIGLMAAMI